MVIFLYGPDTFRSRGKLQELKEKYLREVEQGEHNILKIDEENVGFKEVGGILSARPFLAKKRLIIFENIFRKSNKKLTGLLLEFLENKKDGEDILVFREGDCKKISDPLFSHLKKERYTQEFRPLSNPHLKEWIKEQFLASGLSVSESALEMLQELIGSDLWQMNREIEKITAFTRAKGRSMVSLDTIRLLVQGKADENVFSLLDALSAKNLPLFIKLLENQLKLGRPEVYLNALMVGLFRNLIQIKDELLRHPALTNQEIAESLDLHPFVVRKARKSLASFTLENLRVIYQMLFRADIKLKSTRVLKPRLFIDLIVAGMRDGMPS